MKFPCNCVLPVIIASMFGCYPRVMRNRFGRLHTYWLDWYGRAWQFSRPGVGARPYWRNVIYLGSISRMPAKDASWAWRHNRGGVKNA